MYRRLKRRLQAPVAGAFLPAFFLGTSTALVGPSLDLSKRKKLLDLCYICPRGTREGMPYLVFEKGVFVKHTTQGVGASCFIVKAFQ